MPVGLSPSWRSSTRHQQTSCSPGRVQRIDRPLDVGARGAGPSRHRQFLGFPGEQRRPPRLSILDAGRQDRLGRGRVTPARHRQQGRRFLPIVAVRVTSSKRRPCRACLLPSDAPTAPCGKPSVPSRRPAHISRMTYLHRTRERPRACRPGRYLPVGSGWGRDPEVELRITPSRSRIRTNGRVANRYGVRR